MEVVKLNETTRSADLNQKMLNLGNAPLSFEMARNVLLHPDHHDKIFTKVPYFIPVGGQAYLFQSTLPLCKLHAKFDPFKFLYLGKGYNKEFAILKRYYHLKHNKTELDKNLYNFQRHIYCLANDESDRDTMTIYLVHYFGNEYLLQDAAYRKGAVINSDLGKVTLGELDTIQIQFNTDSHESAPVQNDAEDIFDPTQQGSVNENGSDGVGTAENVTGDAFKFNKRKLFNAPSSTSKNKRKYYVPENYNPTPEGAFEQASMNALKAIQGPDYLFAMNMASQLQQLPQEIKAKVKFQIATVFYEAEMKAINGNIDDE